VVAAGGAVCDGVGCCMSLLYEDSCRVEVHCRVADGRCDAIRPLTGRGGAR
jgi:hypothetical protein